MEKVIYSNKSGLGIILSANENEVDFFTYKEFQVVNTIIKPTDFTNLFGLFTSQVRFCGCLIGDENCMVFHLGNDGNLFELKYYSCFYYINEWRLANKYSENTCRDFNWINGSWK